jgi:hypothetical protein
MDPNVNKNSEHAVKNLFKALSFGSFLWV